MQMALQARQELANHVEANVAPHGDAKADSAIAGGRRAWRLPYPGDERRSGGAAHPRERERSVAVVATRQESARHGVLHPAKDSRLARGKIAIVFVQNGGCTVL